MTQRKPLRDNCKSIVIKIGSAVLSDGMRFDEPNFLNLVKDVANLRRAGLDVAVVCSGAVALGRAALGLKERPKKLALLQASASVGQGILAAKWADALSHFNLTSAQVLLTHDDLKNRRRFIAARQTLRELLELGTIPIINENDAVAVEEIKMGDNDLLSSLVVSLLGAQHLVILSNVNGLLSEPGTSREKRIAYVPTVDDGVLSEVGAHHSSVGSGGMATKLEAIRRVNELGVCAHIADGKQAGVLSDCLEGLDIGTWFEADRSRLKSRKHWIAYALEVSGQLIIDDGAVSALRQRGKSLLPIGVTDVDGDFVEGERVEITDKSGKTIARGLAATDATSMRQMMGKKLSDIESQYGWSTVLVHRDDLIVVDVYSDT